MYYGGENFVYILQRFRISEVVYTTDVLWRGKNFVYTTAVQNFRSRIRQLYNGGENFVSTTLETRDVARPVPLGQDRSD